MVHDKGHVCTCCLMQMSIHLDPAGSIWQHVIALGLPLMSPQENMGANLAEVVVAGLHTTTTTTPTMIHNVNLAPFSNCTSHAKGLGEQHLSVWF